MNIDEKKQLLNHIDTYVLDMDGTFYLGENIIPGSLDFIKTIKEMGKEFYFFTNNSSKSPEEYIAKLSSMGCSIDRKKIMTSGDVTISYLKENGLDKSVYLVGTEPLRQNFIENNINLVNSEPEVVVVAFDTTLTYEKLSNACTFIRNGAIFLATHLDINCPTETGFIPDCGAFCAAITLSTGKEPKYLGKPFKETMDYIVKNTGKNKEKIAVVGDRLYTDIATGVNNGAKGILVLSGEATMEDVKESLVKPTAIFNNLYEMKTLLDMGENK